MERNEALIIGASTENPFYSLTSAIRSRSMLFEIKAINNEALTKLLQRAIEKNPRHFPSYRMIDYLLAQRRDWEAIISYWNRFIALEPNHAEAYYERSGTHYHNRDMKSALRDLARACELGSKDACMRYNKMKR